MTKPTRASSPLPSVDSVLRGTEGIRLIARHGRTATLAAVRLVLAELRHAKGSASVDTVAAAAAARLESASLQSLRPVFNLTGTVLHTNLGRAPVAPEAAAAAAGALAAAVNVEYELESGERGERDHHVEADLKDLTGAEAATVVNNNAAAVFLILNTLALRREVPVSRGELIEIGGSFRMPDIMARAGCRLVEIGTTNRTHLRDFAAAVTPRTAMLMKVHPSNYAIQGFTAAVGDAELAKLAHEHGVPYVVDLGSGTLVDLARFGLPHEPTPQAALAAGADLVSFSGDKLLGGPQAGIVVGRAELVRRLNRNPLKRALRLDKARLAALAATLKLYADPDRLAERLPTLRLLCRPVLEIEALGRRLLPRLAKALAGKAEAVLEETRSQIGSGSLPVDRLESRALSIRPIGPRKSAGKSLEALATAFRRLPIPVVGRRQDGALKLDLRCLEDEEGFLSQLDRLAL
ncbi:MAG: L-seryl-tRNA(Sec) selenium transferase [Proteobacteria bacterium]|nr:L-seryl-tRNA(Sec) selenium transferase [Pseudomonadota bacterium]